MIISAEQVAPPWGGRTIDRGAWLRQRLTLAVLFSCLVHVSLTVLLIAVSRHKTTPSQPRDPGEIELVMVQKQGSSTASPVPPSVSRATANKVAQTRAAETTPENPAAAHESDSAAEANPFRPPPASDAGPLPAEAVTAAQLPQQAVPLQSTPPKAPVFDFAGTNSDYNAIAFGSRIVPAAPDSRFQNHPPRYPRGAALRGEHGVVVLLVHVLASGSAAGADVIQTSGHSSLDNAALAAVRTWHFLPAMQDGKTVPFDMPFRFVFDSP